MILFGVALQVGMQVMGASDVSDVGEDESDGEVDQEEGSFMAGMFAEWYSLPLTARVDDIRAWFCFLFFPWLTIADKLNAGIITIQCTVSEPVDVVFGGPLYAECVVYCCLNLKQQLYHEMYILNVCRPVASGGACGLKLRQGLLPASQCSQHLPV